MSTGAYLRVQREGKWEAIEVENLTDEERNLLFLSRSPEELVRWLNMVCAQVAACDRLISDVIDHVEEMARQECFTKKVEKDYNGQVAGTDVTDSGAISTRAAALRMLAHYGRFRIVAEYGRMVVGYWPENDPERKNDDH